MSAEMLDLLNTLEGVVVVGPKDHLVIALIDGDAKTLDRYTKHLREHRPELADRILFVIGVESLAVLKGPPERQSVRTADELRRSGPPTAGGDRFA